jgi:aminoglycoside phosphotransferase (APT) family kinase protein
MFHNLTKDGRKKVARQIASFLSAVHGFPIGDAPEIGIPQAWDGRHQQNGRVFLEKVAPLLSPIARRNSTDCMERLLVEEFDGRVIHGDFYLPDHVFVKETDFNIGVIDFGDVTIYDPAHDFQCVLEIGGEVFFDTVMANYQGGADPILLKRSQMRLAARPLFVAGYIFANRIYEQYSSRLERVEAGFG